MTDCIICIGSNQPPRHQRIARAIEALRAVADIVATSGSYESNDHSGLGPRYINVAVRAVTDLTAKALAERLRAIETELGRCPDSKESGIMPIDIDLVCYGDAIVSPSDYERPYFRACLTDLQSH